MNTDTPETDAAWACFKGYMEPLQDVQDLSRKLERERDEARLELEKYTTDSEDDALYNVRRLRKELTAVTEQRDMLAKDLRLIADGTSCRECGGEDQALFARQALQSMICDALQSLTHKP